MRGGVDLNETIPENETHSLDIGELNLDDVSFGSQGSLHLSDLDSQLGMNDVENTTEQDISQIENIPHFDLDEHDLNMDDYSLNLSDLDTTNTTNDSGNTTREDISFGGRKHKRRITKKRRSKKCKKTRKNKRKQRGGVCYGNGVGANNYEPNYSIYNTNMLKLFPYKPVN
jgi:hypothetical protein